MISSQVLKVSVMMLDTQEKKPKRSIQIIRTKTRQAGIPNPSERQETYLIN